VTRTDGWDASLESILVCPEDHEPLIWVHDAGVAYNPRRGRGYPIRDGIPQLIASESYEVDTDGRRREV